MGMFSQDEGPIGQAEPPQPLERCVHGKLRGHIFGEHCQECVDAIPLWPTDRERIERIERALLLVARKVYVPLGAKPLTPGELEELESVLSELASR